jgi:hypothetical protein
MFLLSQDPAWGDCMPAQVSVNFAGFSTAKSLQEQRMFAGFIAAR